MQKGRLSAPTAALCGNSSNSKKMLFLGNKDKCLAEMSTPMIQIVLKRIIKPVLEREAPQEGSLKNLRF